MNQKHIIKISSDRNPNKLKVITNYNNTYYRNYNTNIYSNGINKNKKKIFSSLKRKSNTPKLKNSCLSVCENKSPKITNKKDIITHDITLQKMKMKLIKIIARHLMI